MRIVAQLFDLSLSTFETILDRVLNYLLLDCAPRIIKFPTTVEELQAVSQDFEIVSRHLS